MIILTPVYIKNDDPRFKERMRYLGESISSVRKQKNPPIQIIIDDGSSEESFAEIARTYKDSRTIVLRRERRARDLLTCANALNYGLNYVLSSEEFSSDEYISFLHSDDILINLDKRVENMRREGTDFLYSDAIIFFDGNPEGILWEGLKKPKEIKPQDYWIHGKMPYLTMTWTKRFLLELSKFIAIKYNQRSLLDSQVGCGEDIDLALNSLEFLNNNGGNYEYLPEITAGYRIHANSLAEIRNKKTRKKEENFILEKHFGKSSLLSLHLLRGFYRPEEYFACLFPHALKKRKKVKLEDYF